jgi:hypothetical protein
MRLQHPLPSSAAAAVRAPAGPQVSLFGIIKLNGRHLPFAFLALDLLMGQDIWSGVLGILMGHTWVAPPTTPACAVAQPGRGLLSGSTG